jgi:hypothetical protein
VVALLANCAIGLVTSPSSATTTGSVRADADWIKSMQMSDGAIPVQADQSMIWPYLGSYAAWGLARAAKVTGLNGYANASFNWLSWYAAHQDAQGFVQDFNVSGGVEQPSGHMDSTDATSGVFLSATWATWKLQPKTYLPRLSKLKGAIVKAVGAIEATFDSDGLTWALPTWHVKYLMDNAESYGGFRAAAEMAQALGDKTLAARALADAKTLGGGIATLWNDSTQAYDWAKHGNGVRIPTDWTVLYPDSVEQAWAVAYAVTEGRGAALMAHFASAQPDWDQPTATVSCYDGYVYPCQAGYWPLAGWGSFTAGDPNNGQLGAASIRAAAIAVNRSWPFTSGVDGQLIVLETGGPDLPSPS